jgi:hypothetical protein
VEVEVEVEEAKVGTARREEPFLAKAAGSSESAQPTAVRVVAAEGAGASCY